MVDLRAADPLLGVHGAAVLAAKGTKGTLSTHVERLRKKYRILEQAGQLPKCGPLQTDQRPKKIRELYRQHQSALDIARQALEDAKKEAVSIGLRPEDVDLDTRKLSALLRYLDDERFRLETFVRGPIDWAVQTLMSTGTHDPDEAVDRFKQAEAELEQCEKKIKLLRKLLTLRYEAGLS